MQLCSEQVFFLSLQTLFPDRTEASWHDLQPACMDGQVFAAGTVSSRIRQVRKQQPPQQEQRTGTQRGVGHAERSGEAKMPSPSMSVPPLRTMLASTKAQAVHPSTFP